MYVNGMTNGRYNFKKLSLTHRICWALKNEFDVVGGEQREPLGQESDMNTGMNGDEETQAQ